MSGLWLFKATRFDSISRCHSSAEAGLVSEDTGLDSNMRRRGEAVITEGERGNPTGNNQYQSGNVTSGVTIPSERKRASEDRLNRGAAASGARAC
jgi:hypothetical protein